MTYNHILYTTLLIIGGLLALYGVRWLLKKIEKKRHVAIEDDDYLHAVPTSSPVDEPLQDVQDTRTKSFNFRFSIIRHATTMFIVLVIVFAVSVPFLDKIPATLFSLLVAASGFVVGMASRPFIENLIAGIVITFSRHLRIGDTVEVDGNYGTIEDITPIYTIIKGWDWRRYVIPNSDMLSKEFISLTLGDNYRWCYIEFWVAPDTELGKVKSVAIEVARECPHFARHEEPSFWVMGMGKEGIRCWLAAWADSPGDAWMLASEMRTGLAEKLRVLKISPHRYQVDLSGVSEEVKQSINTASPGGQ
ncbi:MAG: mechanosensitive ion channel protein MscS [Desulfuromonas sp.]|nr:MAG: mechanosensitive ion channel protein MscS [Desulfuromonas sp.]